MEQKMLYAMFGLIVVVAVGALTLSGAPSSQGLASDYNSEPCVWDADCVGDSCHTGFCFNNYCQYDEVNPECPRLDEVPCGAPISSQNGCGECGGSGAWCPEGSICFEGDCLPDGGSVHHETCTQDADCYGDWCHVGLCVNNYCQYEDVPPECFDPAEVTCGMDILSKNGCGMCEGRGTYCSEGYYCYEGGAFPECIPEGIRPRGSTYPGGDLVSK